VIGTGLLRKGKTPAGRSGRPRSCTIDSPPRESVVKTDDERVIYYVVDGDKAVQTPVKTGLRDGNLIEVEAEGLKSLPVFPQTISPAASSWSAAPAAPSRPAQEHRGPPDGASRHHRLGPGQWRRGALGRLRVLPANGAHINTSDRRV
jgi:hypothetical protein